MADPDIRPELDHLRPLMARVPDARLCGIPLADMTRDELMAALVAMSERQSVALKVENGGA